MGRFFIALTFSLTAIAAGAGCGDLPNETTVKDLRVLAVKSEPAGFLVDLANPGAAGDARLGATVTALVVDPEGVGAEVTYSAAGCPDYIDTITTATGQNSKLCPPESATSQIPDPIGTALRTKVIYAPDMPASAFPVAEAGIEYAPRVSFGLTGAQVDLFFDPDPTGIPLIDESVALNRDFGLAAIVNMTFNRGAQTATIIKRVVYWPRLDPQQQPNHNPVMTDLLFYKHRNEINGDPEQPWLETVPTVSRVAGDKLYVLPVPAADAAEPYLLRVRNTQTDVVETRPIDRELLTYQFYATSGTFTPGFRESELNPFLTATDGRVHIDSQYELPKAADIPDGGQLVTIWVVVRDERAGTSWSSRTVKVIP